jgi:hypothetical protein
MKIFLKTKMAFKLRATPRNQQHTQKLEKRLKKRL